MEEIKILVADDEKNIRYLFATILEKNGYGVNTCADGEEALKKLKEEYCPIALLDVMMPKMGGLELLKSIKKDYPEIQVIMITGAGSVEIAEKAVDNGAFAFLTKPAKKKEILTAVEHAIEKYKSLKKEPLGEGTAKKEPAKTIIYTLLITNYDGKICKINQATEKMLGYNSGELAGQPVSKMFSEDFKYDQFRELPEKKKEEDFQMIFLTKERIKQIYSFNGTIMNDAERKSVGFVGMLKKKEVGK